MMVWLLALVRYQSLKLSCVLMHAAAAFGPIEGRPSASSVSATAPISSVVQALPPKSVCASPKSRNTAGTRSTHCPLTCSHGAAATQVKPVSTWQVEEQPSPSIRLPSSQASLMMRPSPQSDTHVGPEQFGSTRHSGEQPSNGAV